MGLCENDNSTTDPDKVVTITLFGAFKRYGVGLVITVLTVVLIGAEYGPYITTALGDKKNDANLPAQQSQLPHTSRPDPQQVMVPGEIEWQNEKYNREHGVPVLESLYEFLKS